MTTAPIPIIGPALLPTSADLDRRRFLSHVAWAGTALAFTASGGVLSACSTSAKTSAKASTSDVTFAQISDTHIGFTGPANPDVTATATAAIAQINAMTPQPAFVVHTGDLTHTATPAQFDQVKQLMSSLKAPVFYVPGEHDSTDDNGEKYRAVFGTNTKGDGWSSWDTNGIHFVNLVNTLHLDKLGHLGTAQLDFLKTDLAPLTASTPLVLFSHIPLFDMYPTWGWGTDDATQALSYTKRFGSVTAINGHVHQLMTKIEGNITFYAGLGTAYPLPTPGQDNAPAAKPLTVAADKLRTVLGTRTINYITTNPTLAVTDHPLA